MTRAWIVGGLLGAGVAIFYLALHLLFEFTIRDEGTMAMSPIMMFQGAPLSHYREEHALATRLHEFSMSPLGMAAAFQIGIALGWLWGHLMATERSIPLRLWTSLLYSVATILFLSIPFSAAAAFHHVGWGMECNYQPFGSCIILGILTLPFWGYLLWRAGRSPEGRPTNAWDW